MKAVGRIRAGMWSCLLIAAVAPSPAAAHYLFIRITPPAEGGRAAEVYFSERAEAGDPDFIDQVATTRLWVQAAPGEFQPLQTRRATDRLRAHLPASGTLAVVGVWDYGVLARPGKPAFLLRHFPKAVSGRMDDLNRLEPRAETPLEIAATFAADHVEFTALADGQPLPDARLHTIDVDLSNEELTASTDGRARWTPPAPGNYSVYIERVRREPGESRGRSYDEIREFATLNFNWPPERTSADAEAVALFQEALAARARWERFPGFSAKITGQADGRTLSGRVTVTSDGAVTLQVDDASGAEWVEDQLGSIAMHRGAGASGGERSQPTLWFADEDREHPLGRLLIFDGGQFASSYRVKDRQIMVVNRQLGGQNMTIVVHRNDLNTEGQVLPRDYAVHYWNAEDGLLNRTETVHDRWQRVGEWDLPVEHTVTTASELGLSVRSFLLADHELWGNRK